MDQNLLSKEYYIDMGDTAENLAKKYGWYSKTKFSDAILKTYNHYYFQFFAPLLP